MLKAKDGFTSVEIPNQETMYFVRRENVEFISIQKVKKQYIVKIVMSSGFQWNVENKTYEQAKKDVKDIMAWDDMGGNNDKQIM